MGNIVYRKMDPQVYKGRVHERLKGHEKQINYVYVDVAGVPTVASGVAVVVRGKDGWVVDPVAVKSIEKATGTTLSPKQQTTLQTAADNMNKMLGQQERREANVPLFYKEGAPTGSLQKEADARSNNPQAGTFGINLDKDGKQATQIDNDAIEVRERLFDRTLKNAGIESPPPSMEREAMISIYYNQPRVFNDPKVQEALKSGDRDALIQAINNVPMENPQAKGRRASDAEDIGHTDDPDVKRTESSGGQPQQQPEPEPKPVPQPEDQEQVPGQEGSFLDKVRSTLGDIFSLLTGQSSGDDGSPNWEKPSILPHDFPRVKEPEITLEEILHRRRQQEESPYILHNQDMYKFVQGCPLYGNDDVKVNGYTRAAGEVKAHTRSKPDGDSSNNLSCKKK